MGILKGIFVLIEHVSLHENRIRSKAMADMLAFAGESDATAMEYDVKVREVKKTNRVN